MVIVQHMPTGFTQMYAERLNRLCAMEVREAKNGDEMHRGLALLAPADFQCRVVRIGTKYTVSVAPGEKVSGHRPSVDALFHSMADTVTCKMVGIIMTGMGQDGATGRTVAVLNYLVRLNSLTDGPKPACEHLAMMGRNVVQPLVGDDLFDLLFVFG